MKKVPLDMDLSWRSRSRMQMKETDMTKWLTGRNLLIPFIGMIVVAVLAAGCGGSVKKPVANTSPIKPASSSPAASQPASAAGKEAPVAPENSPPGDIPDSQVFVPFRPASGSFEVKVPEGWAQSGADPNVAFTDKLNTVSINTSSSTTQPTADSANTVEVPQLAQSEPAFQLVETRQVSLPGGPAILIKYQKNSAPNQVTGKKYRMDVLRYEFYRNGVQANLSLESPVGADNVDPWNTISGSFKWL
jgi:hypothetical protein